MMSDMESGVPAETVVAQPQVEYGHESFDVDTDLGFGNGPQGR